MTEEDIIELKTTHPDIYNTIIEKIFNDDTGFFVTKKWETDAIVYVNPKDKDWYNNIPKKYRTKYKKLGASKWNEFVDETGSNDTGKEGHYECKKKGLQVLAIPSNSKIPEWAIPYVDFSTMVNNIIAPFKPVLEIFGPRFIEEGRSKNGVNRKTTTVSNIVKF